MRTLRRALIVCFAMWLSICIVGVSFSEEIHRASNALAIELLPVSLRYYFVQHLEILNRVDNASLNQCFDMDFYGPLEFMTSKVDDLIYQYGMADFMERGALPWAVEDTYNLLAAQMAFGMKDMWETTRKLNIYVGLLHHPLHTTAHFHDRNKVGLYARYDAALEYFADELLASYTKPLPVDFNHSIPYIEKPLAKAFEILEESHACVKNLVEAEAVAMDYAAQAPGSNMIWQVFWDNGAGECMQKLFKMDVENRASFWYSVWVEARRPDLPVVVQTP